ncbi:hypothetical protein LCGC14_1188850 [marine sediment metagenome]|uniref:Uncharacterized protein n=1 Tax=marine sediment metagenome TaxID=412755 RepID=A0A0F9M7S5_9ZZZZ
MWKINEDKFEILLEGPWNDKYDYFLKDAERMIKAANDCGVTPENMRLNLITNFRYAYNLSLIVWIPA